ncbi:hypothetical protein CHUAL_005372 [Chamberlinius hualienensis]
MFTKKNGKRSFHKDPNNKKFKKRKQIDKIPKSKKIDMNEEIPSDSDVEDNVNITEQGYSSEEEETAAEKRLRLSKQIIEKIELEEKAKAETDEIDRSAIAHRLREEVWEQAGKLKRNLADLVETPIEDEIKYHRGHKLSVTCVVLSPDNKFIFSASKDAAIIKWCIITGKRIKVIPGFKKSGENLKGHSDQVLSLAISSDNKYLASGCKNQMINIWNAETMEFMHTLKGHRKAVSGLVFRKGTHQLYSASHDRFVKIWNIDEMAYVETLIGHHDAISAIDALSRERAITSGGRDNSVRIWKIVEGSQLIYNGHTGSIDCVRLINEENFISCGDDGTIALWGTMKKKPLSFVRNAHGIEETSGLANWIISVAALQNSDLVASGSNDGYIRLWKCGEGSKSLLPVASIKMEGHVNSLQFSSDGSVLVAGIGQEHRLGRWFVNKQSKNNVVVIPLKYKTQVIK